jgi:hypothetical protein
MKAVQGTAAKWEVDSDEEESNTGNTMPKNVFKFEYCQFGWVRGVSGSDAGSGSRQLAPAIYARGTVEGKQPCCWRLSSSYQL